MAHRSNDWNTDEDVSIRSKVSQFSNAQDRLQSLLVKTEGVLPGSVPRIGEQAFVKNRITKFATVPQTNASTNLECFDAEKSHPETQSGDRIDDNQARNRAQLEKLKRQLAEKERNRERGETSESPVRGSFANQATLASTGVGLAPTTTKALPPKRKEVQAELLGIIEVKTALRNLPKEKKKRLAQISIAAVVKDSPIIAEDGLELGPIVAEQKSVTVVMEGETVSIMVANASGGGVHEMVRHVLTQVAVLVHTYYNKVLVYIGRETMGRRTAVILEMPDLAAFNEVVVHFKINGKSK